MCNAWNHPPNCKCGWGGEGHLGLRTGFISNEATSRHLDIFGLKKGLLRPNALCPVCGEHVYFYQDEYGGRVFFDDLGPPWPKHGCTDNGKSPTTIISNNNYRANNRYLKPDGWIQTSIMCIEDYSNKMIRIHLEINKEIIKLYTKYFAEIEECKKNRQIAFVIPSIDTGQYQLSIFISSGLIIKFSAYISQFDAKDKSNFLKWDRLFYRISNNAKRNSLVNKNELIDPVMLVTCTICNTQVRKDRIEKHKLKVHGKYLDRKNENETAFAQAYISAQQMKNKF